MTKGVRDLREIEIAFQGVGNCGTRQDPTARIVGICGMKKLLNRVFPMEATGVMEDHIINRYYDPWVMAELPITPGEEGLTFQQFPWFLSMGVEGGVTGPTWTFQPAWTTADVPDPATIRYGDNARMWEATCCFARQLVISGAFQGPWQIEADIIGRDMVTSAKMGLPYPTDPASFGPLETILGQLTRYYSEAGCTDIHDTPTPVAGSLIDWRVTIPGFHPKFFQDGELYYTTMGLDSRHLTFEATVEFDTDHATGEWDAWVNATPRYVRLQALGGDAGAGNTMTAQIDMNIMYETFETLEERDGNDIIRFTARTVYDVTCGACEAWQVVVINDFAALP